jgi:hypothetical protein
MLWIAKRRTGHAAHIVARMLTSATEGELNDLAATRRGLLLAPLLAALPAALFPDPAHAIDPN